MQDSSFDIGPHTHNDRAIVIGSTGALASFPDQTAAVCNDASRDRGAIVATQSDKHHANLGHLSVHLEVVYSLLGSGNEFAALILGHTRGTVSARCLQY